MPHIDIFNGDADGICALVQLRNAAPVESTLITGVKRDIALVAKADPGPGDRLTVLDVSFHENRDGVAAALDRGAQVFYVDHHFAGEIPRSDALTTLIDPSPDTCTSILVNRHLEGRYAEWAATGAFGDNLGASAIEVVKPLDPTTAQLALLEDLGTYMNYNGYGASIEDLHFPPDELFRRVRPYASPFDFAEDARETFDELETGYREDMASAEAIRPAQESDTTAVYVWPDQAWARRASGVFSNRLANRTPTRAHAVITERADGTYLVSVRAPLRNKVGADDLCRRFPSGGGRKAAAGINHLPADQLDDFIEQFSTFYA
jgi:single-stranded DNA-specific DHH superfamily exonuclease